MARWVPEVAAWWFVDASSGADNVYVSEFIDSSGKHRFEIRPFRHVSLSENGARAALRVLVHEALSFRTKGEVGEKNICAFAQ